MKKSLFVAAMFAAAALATTPSFSADMPAAAAAPEIKPICFFLPLLPDCIAAFKAHHDAEVADGKMKMPTMAAIPAPTLPALPKCEAAPEGSGHMLDCK